MWVWGERLAWLTRHCLNSFWGTLFFYPVYNKSFLCLSPCVWTVKTKYSAVFCSDLTGMGFWVQNVHHIHQDATSLSEAGSCWVFTKCLGFFLFFFSKFLWGTYTAFLSIKKKKKRMERNTHAPPHHHLLLLIVISDLPTRPYLTVFVRKPASSSDVHAYFSKCRQRVSRKYGNHDVNECKFVASKVDCWVLMEYRLLTFA